MFQVTINSWILLHLCIVCVCVWNRIDVKWIQSILILCDSVKNKKNQFRSYLEWQAQGKMPVKKQGTPEFNQSISIYQRPHPFSERSEIALLSNLRFVPLIQVPNKNSLHLFCGASCIWLSSCELHMRGGEHSLIVNYLQSLWSWNWSKFFRY